MQSTDWTALQVLRALEETANRERATSIELTVSAEVALYILNQKRQALSEIEERNGLSVTVSTNGEIRGGIWEIEVPQRAEGASNKRGKEISDEESREEGGRRRRRGRRRKSASGRQRS